MALGAAGTSGYSEGRGSCASCDSNTAMRPWREEKKSFCVYSFVVLLDSSLAASLSTTPARR